MSGPALLSIIVPVYNEVATSRAVIDRLLAIDLPLPREVLVIDDGSTDGTWEVLDDAVRERLPIVVTHVPRNAGKGRASARVCSGPADRSSPSRTRISSSTLSSWRPW